MALLGAFIRRLSEEIKDELAARDETDSLEALIFLAVCLDSHVREAKERKLGVLGGTPPIPNHLKLHNPHIDWLTGSIVSLHH